jgi:hypothetical protein
LDLERFIPYSSAAAIRGQGLAVSGYGTVPKEYDKKVELMQKRPRLVLDRKAAQEIRDAFAGIFSQADKRLQKPPQCDSQRPSSGRRNSLLE